MPPMMPTGRTRRPSRPISAQDLLEGGWVAYQHPEGEGYPESMEDLRRRVVAEANEIMRSLPPADHPGWSRLAREVRPVTATAPKVERLPQVERRRRQLRRRVVAVVSWVVIVAVCLLVGWAFADGIGGAR